MRVDGLVLFFRMSISCFFFNFELHFDENAIEYVENFISGCSQSEINRMLPKADERRRYSKRTLSYESMQLHQPKRPKIDDQIDIDFEDFREKENSLSPQEVNENFVLENLTLEKAVAIAEVTLSKLPDTMPVFFAKDYDKLVKAGTIGNEDITILLMTNLLTENGLGPGVANIEARDNKKRERENDDERGDEEKVICLFLHSNFLS